LPCHRGRGLKRAAPRPAFAAREARAFRQAISIWEVVMQTLYRLFVILTLAAGIALPAIAGDKDPLFINLTSDDAHRATMALAFGKNQLERGHPLTVFLNDKGVLLGAKANAGKFAHQQKTVAELVGKGATVLICPMCMQHYGVKDADVLAGVKVGNPELTGAALFKDDTKTLTW
jgi:sulfur relay (sulfurtransferase) complex TusBCD TusD component (DsrE family)